MEEKKEIVAGNPVTVAGLTVIPIVETRLNFRRCRNSVSVSGSRRAIGVIITSPQGEKAFNINGEEVAPGELKEEFPDVESLSNDV